MRLINIVRLSTMCISIVVIMQKTQEKANLQKMEVNATKIRKVRADGNKLRTGKE